MAIGLYDLLGLSEEASPRDALAALWPVFRVQVFTGEAPVDLPAITAMVENLSTALTFTNVRPGAFAGGIDSGEAPAVGLTADLHVGAPLTAPFVFSALPKVEFHPLQTQGVPPKIYIRQTPNGAEWIVEALPVEIKLPERLVIPLEPKPGAEVPLEATVTDGFVVGQPDTLKIVLRRDQPSSIFVHIKLHVTDRFDFVLEPAVPISIGPCRFSGIPSRGIHDLNFLLTPRPSDSLDPRAEALEWLRHDLDTSLQDDPPGFITVRTIDLNNPGSRLDDATTTANTNRADDQRVQVVLEDVALPNKSVLPWPAHFTAGMRRALGPSDDPNGLYKLGDHPVVVTLKEGTGPDKSGGLYMIVRELFVRSVGPDDAPLSTEQFAFVNLAFSDDPAAEGKSVTVELTDEWTVQAGLHIEPPKPLFTLFNVHVAGSGIRAGVSFKKLFADDAGDAGTATDKKSLFDALVLLADLQIVLGGPSAPGSPPEKDTLVKVTPTADKPTTVVVDGIGWKLGDFTIGSFWDPNKTELKAAGVIRLSIDEFGFTTEPNGARYFSFSGSWPITGKPSTAPATSSTSTNTDPSKGTSAGISFYRLRWKIRGPEDASEFLIDGIGISFSYGHFALIGSGMLSDRIDGGIRYREAGIALTIQARIGGTDLKIGGQFFHGRATGPSVDFQYLLAGLEVSPIPIAGAVQLTNVRGLFAWNMTPDTGPSDPGSAQPMQLFTWYKAHGDGVSLPPGRNISAAGWTPQEDSYTFAAGAGVTISGSHVFTIDAFFLYAKSPAAKGFLAAIQLFISKSKNPIAYAVVEFDDDRWSLLLGLALGWENVTSKKIPFLTDAPLLTGTLYATNKPGTVAIGHIDDPSSWFALHIVGNLWVFKVELFAGFCLELVDLPEGPRVLGLRVSFSGGSRLCAIGGLDFYLTMELIAGVWRNESQVSGFTLWLEGGIDIDVLWVFQFGVSVKVEWDYLGPDPAFRRIGCEVHIHTPWWMPDKTFTWNKTLNQPELDQMATISAPLAEANAHPLAAGTAGIAGAVSALPGDPGDGKATFNIAQLTNATPPPWSPDTLAAAVPVAIDSIVALAFKASVDDKLRFGQSTPPGAGTQSSNDVSTKYELVELAIRRTPRFGPQAGVWTDLIAGADSRTDNLPNLPPQQLAALFKAPFGIRWDGDFQREQRLDPRHLLLNAETPYLHLFANLEADENLVRNMPGWPCCHLSRKLVPAHTLDFRALKAGDRAPRTQAFSGSTSLLHWLCPVLPRVLASQNPLLGQIGRLATAPLAEGAFARIAFDQPAANASLYLNWPALHVPRTIVISGFRGLKLVQEQSFALSAMHNAPLTVSDTDGFTHILLRITGAPVLPTPPATVTSGIEIVSLGYQSVAELRDGLLGEFRCGAVDPAAGGNGSRFAWLPNHDYEVAIRTRVTVADDRSGTLAQEVPQLTLFRTKGLPGANQPVRIGEELEPYVESLYPAPGAPLYRTEPAMLAFNEKFDILQGLDRPVLPTDPAERQQRLDWILAAELVAGSGEPARLTVPSADWIVAHRGTGVPPPPPPRQGRPFVLGLDPADPILRALQREAQTLDPLRLRLEAVLATPGSCHAPPPAPRKTRVLAHDPADPAADAGATRRWPAATRVRMNMRVAGSPFVDRAGFDDGDDTAFTPTGAAWTLADGVLHAPDAGTQFALFGDAGWTNFQLSATIDPGQGMAGVAVAVSASGGSSRALVAWIDGGGRRLTIASRIGNLESELTGLPLPDSAAAPYLLELIAFDDVLQARVGTAQVSVPRGDFRTGQAALAARGPAGFTSLTVDGLDGYRFEFTTSRFDDFAGHIASFKNIGALDTPGTPTSSPKQLLQADADFAAWTTALALPLRTSLERLEVGVRRAGDAVDLLLVETPEPLGADVTLRLFATGGTETEAAIITVAAPDGSAAIVVPLAADGTAGALPPGAYRLGFTLDRTRYRAAVADSDSNFRQTASILFAL